ncbi:MAG: M50 family metallopeptidase [Candidatus Aenigmarchaeota archaeon]|nr:M50 family metallopeptidase [Candidatus Aenigmarchaeota archaeon]
MPSRATGLAGILERLSLQEKWGLAVTLLTASLVFAYNFDSPLSTFAALPGAFVAVFIAVAAHEAFQRWTAKRLGCSAAFEMWLPGVIFSLLMMLLGIKILAVGGAVVLAHKFSRFGMRERHASIEEVGIISMAGPAANLLLATFLQPFAGPAGLAAAIGYLANINAMFALYSLIPLKQIDGGNFMMWSVVFWLLAVMWALLLLTPYGLLPSIVTF